MSDSPVASPLLGGSAKRHSGRLLRRTFAIALLLVSGGLLASGLTELYFRYRESLEGIDALQRSIAQATAFKIQEFVRDIENTLRAATQTQDIVAHGLTDAYRFQLIKLLKIAPAITDVAAVKADGMEQMKMSRMRPSDSLGDRSGDPAFLEARTGKSFFSPVYFVRESEPYMRIAVPIERYAGDVQGVLIAEVNLKYIWDVVAGIKHGETGYAYVISPEGDLIAHPDISLVLQKRNLSDLSQVRAALAEESGPLPAQLSPVGQNIIPAYAPIPGLGWTVFVEQSVREAYTPLYASVLRSAVLLLVGLVTAVIASVMLSRRVLKPVETLKEGAEQIGRGALDYRINVKTGDELEALADEFNNMASQLEASYSNLEKKVQDRTAELTRALEQQTATSEILRVISASPNDLQPVLSAVAQCAVRLCEANGALVCSADDGTLREVVACGLRPDVDERNGERISRSTVTGSAILEGRVIHIGNGASQAASFPESASYFKQFGIRTVLATPLRRGDAVLGAIVLGRTEARPFVEKQVALVNTFADQCVIAIESVRLFQEVQERELDRLKRYVSPQVAEAILHGEDRLLQSHRREITVVFTDLRGFTAFSDVSEPEEVMDLLRTYHTEIGKLIFEFDGTLEGFWGDGIMVFFNDPIPCEDHTEKAVRMALAICTRGEELRAAWLKKGHDLDLGLGLAAGFATLGNIGFEGRMEYAAMGNVINLAARLCAEAKGGQILTDQKTLMKVEALVEAELVAELHLKGFARPVDAFNIVKLKQ